MEYFSFEGGHYEMGVRRGRIFRNNKVRDYADFFYYILSDTDSNQPINKQELSDLLKKGQQNEMASTYKNVVSLLAEGCYRNQ